MKPIFELKENFGQLYIYDDKIVIERKGFRAFIWHGLKGGKTIPISSLTTIQFKAAGKLTNGYIQFGMLGSVESGGGILSAQSNENTIFFQQKNAEIAEKIKLYLENKISEKSQTTQEKVSVNNIDELKKFKELLDSGIITQDEFEQKKKHLLNL